MRLLFATQNQHKAAEINAMLGDEFEVLSLKDLNSTDDVEENGEDLDANAALKAQFIHQKYRYNCFADDTGLMVDALNGEPGVFSARYAGPEKSDSKNIALLLSKLEGQTNRKARFETVICLMLDGEKHFFRGVLHGKITETPAGTNGFGYDPVFLPDGYDITLAQMSLNDKNKISHRAKAFAALTSFLNKLNSSDQS